MAEAADGPDGAAATEWDLAVDNPETGSAFVDGHNARAGFFRICEPSPFVMPLAWFGAVLAAIVAVEDVEAIEEEELDRRMNMRLTSSVVIAFKSS